MPPYNYMHSVLYLHVELMSLAYELESMALSSCSAHGVVPSLWYGLTGIDFEALGRMVIDI